MRKTARDVTTGVGPNEPAATHDHLALRAVCGHRLVLIGVDRRQGGDDLVARAPGTPVLPCGPLCAQFTVFLCRLAALSCLVIDDPGGARGFEHTSGEATRSCRRNGRPGDTTADEAFGRYRPRDYAD